MTSIAFGGAPTLDERRSFAGLKYGTHVPGYRGYCPQIKYRVAQTYGKETHDLAQCRDHVLPADPVGLGYQGVPQDRLPDPTGDNKYTKKMVSGYTGYIPRKTFKYGNTYKEDCDYCIDQFLKSSDQQTQKISELKKSVRSYPKLQPIGVDPRVRNELNKYRDTHPSQPILLDDRRAFTEPPMPGYQGYIPRVYTTEQGLGVRYHTMAANGLTTFEQERNLDNSIKTQPVSVDRGDASVTLPSYNRRLYPGGGMVPKYTGYCPQRMYHYGNTYGDTTRSLDVCKHTEPCFGDFSKKLNQSM